MKNKKQYAVIGLGRFGTSVAVTLHKMDHEVLAINSSKERVQGFSDEVTSIVQADTTGEETLSVLVIRKFDVVVVAIGEDIQANILTALQLKELGVPHIITKAKNSLHCKILEKLGAVRVIYPERGMGQRIDHDLVSSNVIDYIEISPNLGIVKVRIPQVLVGKILAGISLRAKYEINVIAIKRGEILITPPLPTEKFNDYDILVVVGGIKEMQRLEDIA